MVKRVSLFIMIFTVCIFAENTTETKHSAPEAAHVTEQVAAESAPAVETEEVATEATAAAETVETAPVAPVVAAAPAATGSAKEAIIEDPLEFAIVTAVFIATVLFITLTE